MLLKSSVVAFFCWRAIEGLMPVVGGLVPIQVALEIGIDAATGLMRDAALAGLVAFTSLIVLNALLQGWA